MTANRTAIIGKLTIIMAGSIAAVYVGVNYRRAWLGPQLVKESPDECIRCHSDAKTLKAMNDKAGYDVVHTAFE